MRIKFFYIFTCSRSEISAVFISAFFLAAAQCRMFFFPAEKILSRLRNPGAPLDSYFLRPLLNLRTTRLVSLLEAVDRNFFRKPSCLRRAIALSSISRRLGQSPEFKLGVRQDSAGFQAHCWLELNGVRLEMEGQGFSYSLLTQGGKG